MSTVTVSPKFQVVIPAAIRVSLGLKPGQKLSAIQLGQRIELVPLRPIQDARGMLKGMDTAIEREDDRL
jgi:AbrB family looped-hinge helix DNA binding protein